MKKFFVFILSVCSLLGFGQNADPFKFTSVIDQYEFPSMGATGILDAQIPLYNISTKGLDIPLSLSYDQNGNTNIYYIGNQFGDAWILNAIGTISRKSFDRSHTAEPAPIYGYCPNDNRPRYGFSGQKFGFGPFLTDEMYYRQNSNVKNRSLPDEFTFSFLGLSGKFAIYNENGVLKAELLESTDFAKIEVVQPQIGELINTIYISDKNGYKYKFASPSNIDRNQGFESYFLNENAYIEIGCHLTNTDGPANQYALNPENSGLSFYPKDTMISKKLIPGEPYWRNLEISEIYDNNNNLLIKYEYDTVGVGIADQATAFINGIGMRLSYTKLFVKKIDIINQGSVNFTNTLASNSDNVLYSYTNAMEVKDLKSNVIKKFNFNYIVKDIRYIHYIEPMNNASTGLNFQKRLLSLVKESDLTNNKFLNTTMGYLEPSVAITQNNTVIDRYGFLAKVGYCTLHSSLNTYKANTYILQKIKYSTGGSVVYKFEPNTFSKGYINLVDSNHDNHNYTPLTLINGSNGIMFNANSDDVVYLLNKNNLVDLSLIRKNQGQEIVIGNINNSRFDMPLTENHCKHHLTNIKLPPSDNNQYIIRGGGVFNINDVVVYKFEYKDIINKFNYIGGSRISKIAYFKDNVSNNILNTSNGESSAEKVISFDYSDQSEERTSSGRAKQTYERGIETSVVNGLLYQEVITEIKNIGKQYVNYHFVQQISPLGSRIDVKKVKLYDNSNEIVSETNHDYTYRFGSFQSNTDSFILKPSIKTSSQTSNNYEGTEFATTNTNSIFNDNYLQLSSSTLEDNLGKTTKSEFDYDVKGNKIVNTQQRNYVDNNLKEQLLNTYGTMGDFIKTEFKTPEMSTYEKVGNENNKHIGGLVRGYIQPDGTPVTLLYGYLDTQVIAKMVNVDANLYYESPFYQTIRTNLDVYSTQWHANYNEANLKTALNSLRTAFPNALVTTYTYKPMVGVSSVTDENGKTTTYEYDSFNRLATVKDYLGNILKEYQYNFTN